MKCKRDIHRKIALPWLFLTLSVLFVMVCTGVSAQDRSDRVTISFSNIPLSTAIERIERASYYTFFYDASSIDLTRRMTLDARQMNIKDALIQMLGGTGIHFEISNRQIVLIPSSRMESLSDSRAITVRGMVTHNDTKAPLSGVVVNVKGTQTHVVTDASGNYSISAPANGRLVFSYLGMHRVEVPVISRANISIAMKHDVVAVEEVIVTGYQTISKERTTGSFGTINSAIIAEKPKLNLASVLEGQVAGLNIDNDGNIAIRGVSSFQAGKAPLVVVDGFPVEASLFDEDLSLSNDGVLAGINPDNIDNIYVLKDAVAASIYGARAANGVIVVTTKKGSRGKTQVSYKGTLSWQSKPKMSDMRFASAADYVDAQTELYRKNPSYFAPGYLYPSNVADVFYNLFMADIGRITADEATQRNEALKGNDYLSQLETYVFRPQFTHQHNLQVTGGSEKHLYNIAANFTDTRENFKHANNSRFVIDMGNDWNFNKWLSMSINMNVSYSTTHTPTVNPRVNGFTGGDGWFDGNLLNFSNDGFFAPYTSIVDQNGNPVTLDGVTPYYAEGYEYLGTLKSWDYNPLNNLNKEVYDTQDFQARINAMIRFRIIDGLNAEIGGTWQRGNYLRKQLYEAESFTARRAFNSGTMITNPDIHVIPEGAILNEMRNNNQNWTIRGQINFSKDFMDGKHRVTALAGMEVRKMTHDNNRLETRAGYNEVAGAFTPMDMQGWLAGDYGWSTVGTSVDFNGTQGSLGYMDNRFVSYYGNASYEFNEKYILSGSIRLDQTNFFGTDKKYRYRPMWSVGGTWKLSQERFFNVSFIDKLDLRASYGINGNIALDQGPFLILGLIETYGGWLNPYSNLTGGLQYRVLSPPNDQLRWEKTASFNAGLDLSMLSNRLRMTIDYYHKNSTDLLAPDNIDNTTGYSNLTINAGQIVNKGIEVTLGVDILRNMAVKWNLQHVFSYNKNKVNTYNISRLYVSYWTGDEIDVAGYTSSGLWSYRFAEINPDNGTVMGYTKDGDKTHMGNLGIEDLIYSGTTVPKYDLSLTNRFSYKNWDLSFMIVAKLGHVHRKQVFSGNQYTSKYVSQRWKNPGDITLYPELTTSGTEFWYHPSSDIFIRKSNFARLRDITLGYNFDRSWLSRMGLESARVFVQARNLFLIKAKDVDIDPDVSLYVGPSRPKELFIGLQIAF